MENLKELLYADTGVIILGIFTLLGAFVFSYTLITQVGKILGIEFKWKRTKNEDHVLLHNLSARLLTCEEQNKDIKNDLNRVINTIDNINQTLNKLEERSIISQEATIETMADRLNQKCKYYIEHDGIPEDEVDDFARMYDAYTNIGGNHGVKAKYDYCTEHLSIVPTKNKILTKLQDNKSN